MDRGKSARVAAFLELEALPGGDAGYRAWVKDCQDKVAKLGAWRAKLDALDATQGEAKNWRDLMLVFKNHKAKIEPELNSYASVMADENLKSVLHAQEQHNRTIEAINKVERPNEWSVRIGLLKSYSDSGKRRDEALDKFKNQPGNEAGGRK